jgi:hypothetical protein
VYAWKEVSFKGKTYHLRLGMPQAADYDAFSPGQKGAKKDLKWQLSGLIPDRPRSEKSPSGYFGGSLSFINMDSKAPSMPRGTEIKGNLTPVAGATLFDGSAPQTIVKTFVIDDVSE